MDIVEAGDHLGSGNEGHIDPLDIDLGELTSFGRATELARRWMPELSGSVDSRHMQMRARDLVAGAAWYVCLTRTAVPPTLRGVRDLLDGELSCPDSFLGQMRTSADPEVVTVAVTISAEWLVWPNGRRCNFAVSTAVMNLTDGRIATLAGQWGGR